MESETMQLQCGNCQKLMAISVEYLGGQVQCPHCKAVVQTPPRTAPAKDPSAAPTKPAIPNMQLNERESIFAGEEMTEDAIGSGAPEPSMPRQSRPMGGHSPAALDTTVAEAHDSTAPGAAEAESSQDPQADLASFKRRPIYDKSLVSLYLMIILIPYSITTTLFILYLLIFAPRGGGSLENLPDPVPGQKQGGPRKAQLAHNSPLAAHLRTPLGKSVQVGDLVVLPERVRYVGDDLKLFLRVRNVSASTTFEPINDFYLRYRPSKKNDPGEIKPYTYLESTSKNDEPVYGGYLEYLKKSQGKEQLISSGLISPREEAIAVITTMHDFRPEIERIIKSSDSYLWRVQVRRGFSKINSKDVSRTAVIGVEFNAGQIETETKKS